MSTAYELHGRTAQKQRTRDALVAAAQQLIADGLTPTVEATADAASISRTTAYRYFPNQAALLATAYPETAAASLLPDDPPADPEARLMLVVDRFLKILFESEPQQRTMLRLSLDPNNNDELPLRKGRAIGWLTDALEPVAPTLGDRGVHRLVLSIRSAIGIEALVWLVDIVGLSRKEAKAQMRWTATMLYRAAAADSHA
jgi:AcrR family transcriptional regulator